MSKYDKVRKKAITQLEREFKRGCDKDDAKYYWSESFYWFTRVIDITIDKMTHARQNTRQVKP